ncbi:MAG: sugar ABC transporter permease [Actinomycetota bacterium]
MTATATAPTTSDTTSPRRLFRRRGGDGWGVALWFLLPSLIGFVIFFLIPTIRAIRLSFQRATILNIDAATGVGFDNYSELWNDDRFWKAVEVTAKYVVLNIGSQTILALFLAVMMNRLTKSLLVRGVVLLPWILPNVLVGLLFLFMLDPSVGVVNVVLGWFGIDPIAFLANPDWVVPALAFMNTWKFTGYTALLLFAGMQVIPDSLYEAGALDGASEWKMFRTITLPLLRPVLALVMVVSLIGSFQVFDTVQAAGGGVQGNPGDPLGESRVLYLYIYENAFLFQNKFGYAAALATVLMVFLMVITLLQLWLTRANQSDLA